MPYLQRSFSAKEPYNDWVFRGKRPATQHVYKSITSCKSALLRQALAYAFVSVHDQPSVDIAREINRCQLHVLLDLNGHTKGNRLDILALQPAAVQVRLCFIFPSSLLRFPLLISAKEPYK